MEEKDRILILKYARLTAENSRQGVTEPTAEMVEIEKELQMTAVEILQRAAEITLSSSE
ncbi:MAG: hypothetical protein AAB642_00410 [Patescibacteria group bacterium]